MPKTKAKHPRKRNRLIFITREATVTQTYVTRAVDEAAAPRGEFVGGIRQIGEEISEPVDTARIAKRGEWNTGKVKDGD